MSKVTFQLPESLHRSIKARASAKVIPSSSFSRCRRREDGGLRTVDYLRREAAAARREDFERFLAAVPNREPVETYPIPD